MINIILDAHIHTHTVVSIAIREINCYLISHHPLMEENLIQQPLLHHITDGFPNSVAKIDLYFHGCYFTEHLWFANGHHDLSFILTRGNIIKCLQMMISLL